MVEPSGSIMLLLIALNAGTGNTDFLSSWLITKDIMSKNIPDFSGFLTDNSSSTNLKYDIITSKFMTGIQNHERRSATVQFSGIVLYLIGAVLELALAIVVLIFVGLRWVWKR